METCPLKCQLRARDLTILRGFFESRIMTGEHAAALFSEGRSEAAKKRLQKLKAARLIAERPRNPFEPATLYLAKLGIAALAERGVLQRRAKTSRLDS